MINGDELQARVNIVDVVGKYVTLTKKGAEYDGICPFHNDTKASLRVNPVKQVYKCFSCGAGGDSLDFLQRKGMDFKEACEALGHTEQTTPKPAPQPEWQQALPDSAPSSIQHWTKGNPSRVWAYHTHEGRLLGYVCRFENEDGSKDILPFTFQTNGKTAKWKWKGFAEPRPLYNLHKVVSAPLKTTIVVVEGEKTADSLQERLPSAVVTTWQGGSKAIKKTDWTPLAGRKVIMWADHDVPGYEAMGEISALLTDSPVKKFVRNPEGAPKGWDVADAPWSADEVRAYMLANLSDTLIEQAPEPEPQQEPDFERFEVPDYPDPTPAPSNELRPFRVLGYNKTELGNNEFYIYSYKSKQVLRFTPGSFTDKNLIQLADLGWWQHTFPAKNGFDADMAAQYLMNSCYDQGVYDSDNIRGIGAWYDEGRVIVHAGTHLVSKGAKHDLREFESKHIYEANKPFGFELKPPASTKDAHKFLELIQMMSWERPVNSFLFAGWCIIAPVCGALPWRPHIWVTGSSGTGKTTAMGIIKEMIGKIAVHAQGVTTEAGVRQTLGHDARPVIFDEADSDGRNDADRLQSILALVRASSSSDGGLIIKGGQQGTSKSFQIRSCFAFASISPKVQNQADRSRVTVLSLVKDRDTERARKSWEIMQRLMLEIIQKDYAEAMISRTLSILPAIIENARVFAKAAAAVLGEQRAGDQLGALLAGAYSLHSNGVITFENAVKWVSDKDWTEIKNTESDELTLLSRLMETITTVEGITGNKYERTIGELILRASDNIFVEGEIISKEGADMRLKRLGFKAVDGGFLVANSSTYIDGLLKETNWSKNHQKILIRIPGSKQVDATRFAPTVRSRAVFVPLEYLQ
jgi:putative DNA primase/helicase